MLRTLLISSRAIGRSSLRLGYEAFSAQLVASTSFSRSFQTSTSRRASEVPKDPLADPEIQAFYEKIRNHQGAVDAMLAIGKIMQEKGIDTSKPPSTMQMMKLSVDKDMLAAGKTLMEELKNAGVEMSPDVMKALFSKMRQ